MTEPLADARGTDDAGSEPGARRFVICLENSGYAASLELRKLYEAIPDQAAAQDGDVRVIDESGEDYLYPAAWFEPLDLPEELHRRVLRAS